MQVVFRSDNWGDHKRECDILPTVGSLVMFPSRATLTVESVRFVIPDDPSQTVYAIADCIN